MNIVTLLPFILIIGVMLLMTRSAKNKQRQASAMRDQMQPGSGVRTVGGMIALVKEVRDTTVLLEVAPGVHSVYAKNAVGAVLGEEEYDRLVNNDLPLTFEDDEHAAAAVTDADADKVDLGKHDADADPADAADAADSDDAPADTDTGSAASDTRDAEDAGKK